MTPPTRRVCLFLLRRRSAAAVRLVALCAAICNADVSGMRMDAIEEAPQICSTWNRAWLVAAAADEARANESAKRELRTESSMRLKIEMTKRCTGSFQRAAASPISCCVVQKAEVFLEEARQVGMAVGMHAPAQQGRVNTCLDHAL